jgi:hypothetical protein
MRRVIGIATLIVFVSLFAGIGQHALATPYSPPPPAPPLDVVAPAADSHVSRTQEFTVQWTRVKDVLWYDVLIYTDDLEEVAVEYRYVPDTAQDRIRLYPDLIVGQALLEIGEHRVVVTAYGLSDALIAQYGAPDPFSGVWPHYPTDLPLDWYTVMAISEAVPFTVDQ